MRFVNLHGHSTFSTFDGFGYPNEHIDAAIEKGMDSVALTDHGSMNGMTYQVLHSKKLAKAGKSFKPIFGVEAYVIPSYEAWIKEYASEASDDDAENSDEEDRKKNKGRYSHLVLLAKNENGYQNLCKLVSASNGKYFYRKPRMDFELLKMFSKDVIALSACLAGLPAKVIWNSPPDESFAAIQEKLGAVVDQMQAIFGDDWYPELQWNSIPEQHLLNMHLLHISKERGLRPVSTCDAHYPKREHWEAREIYKRLGWLSSSSETPEWAKKTDIDLDKLQYELYIKNADDMLQEAKRYSSIAGVSYNWDDVAASIEQSAIISDQIEAFYPSNEAKFPKIEGNAKELLRSFCESQLDGYSEEYRVRLEHELDTIDFRGFESYFLTMKKISDFARDHYLTGPGRGSAAGSLIAYLLKITQVDPIKHGLLFSRFMRRDAEGFPDIDYDVSDRIGLVEDLSKAWGEFSVVPITNWNTLSIKSLAKDLAKLYDVPFQEVNEVTRKMDSEAIPPAKEANGIKSGVYTPTLEEYVKYSPAFADFLDKYPKIGKYLEMLISAIRSQSRHAGGIIVGDNINEYMPLIRSSKMTADEKVRRTERGLNPWIYQTPWPEGQHVRHLEPMGFIKFDILGLETLSIIENAIKRILKKEGKAPSFENMMSFYNEQLHPDKLNLRDEKVFKYVFHEGRWPGIFQFSEDGAQKFCSQVKPDGVDDLGIITSIYRPGPLGAKVHEKYLNTKRGNEPAKYYHPLHKEVAEQTHGFLIFQEQIALLAHKLGKDVNLDEGDLLRKVLTKKGTGKDEVKDKIHQKFLEGCLSKNISKQTADEIWETFILFAGYGFNKSHAICYSIISYQCAWLFTYHPNEWLPAWLDSEQDKQSKGDVNKKEQAINMVKSFGYSIVGTDVNLSETNWEARDGKLIQPITGIKGIGEKALAEIMERRPFNSIPEFVFHPKMSYQRVNKKIINALILTGALDSLWKAGGFKNQKHLWKTICENRPKNLKQYNAQFEQFKDIEDFTSTEKIEAKTELAGMYPLYEVITDFQLEKLKSIDCPPISRYKGEDTVTWGVSRGIEIKKTKSGKTYAVISLIDDSFVETKVKCWSWFGSNDFELNALYFLKPKYQDDWGLSTNNFANQWRIVPKEKK